MNESVMDPQGPSHEKSWMICNLQIQHAFVEKWGILLERSPVNRKGQHIQTDRHIHSHILTHRQFRVFFLSSDLHVFGLWEEIRAAAENTFRHAEKLKNNSHQERQNKTNSHPEKCNFCPSINQKRAKS